ncbi:restriction endonuclease subunit S [Serratia marcescens]|uniref:restriction endonuclease subunit S n=1 Tax=Serratia marcescens TaxID=615 RepID=UPI0018D99095|nr:restriction endonuclease subunit S [Serratia marcescens]
MKIDDLFLIDVARSKSTEDYSPGSIPFVTNTEINNGVVRYVDPLDKDKVFDGPAICISGLGYATVQFGKFLPKGNGGDSCTVLLPKTKMSNYEILYYSALFNVAHGWRFTFGRKTSKTRLKDLDLEPVFADSPVCLIDEIELNNKLMTKLLLEKEIEIKG